MKNETLYTDQLEKLADEGYVFAQDLHQEGEYRGYEEPEFGRGEAYLEYYLEF